MPGDTKSTPRPEEMALAHYGVLGNRGIWSENSYWSEVMALLFWDVIFAKLRGVYSPALGEFPGRPQDMPHDFFSDDFYRKRVDMIRHRIRELREIARVSQSVRDSYFQNKGKPCRPIWNWDRYSVDSLCAGVDSVSKDQLFAIMNRLLVDFNHNRSGLPDLFFYSPKPLFVEVKASSDSLRGNQVEWLRFLAQTLRLPVEVLLADHTNTKIDSVKKLLAAEGFSITVART